MSSLVSFLTYKRLILKLSSRASKEAMIFLSVRKYPYCDCSVHVMLSCREFKDGNGIKQSN